MVRRMDSSSSLSQQSFDNCAKLWLTLYRTEFLRRTALNLITSASEGSSQYNVILEKDRGHCEGWEEDESYGFPYPSLPQ